MHDHHTEIQIVTPEDAAAILQPKIKELQSEGWVVLVQHDYMARLTRGSYNMDLQIDLLGELHMEQKAITLAQESGQWIAIVFFILLFLGIVTVVTVFDLI